MKIEIEKDELVMIPESEIDVFQIGGMFNALLSGTVDFGLKPEKKIASYKVPINVVVERLAKIGP